MKYIYITIIFTLLLTSCSNTKENKQTTNTKKAPKPLPSLTLLTPKKDVLKDENITLTLKDKNGTNIENNITWIMYPIQSIKPTNTNTITPIKDDIIISLKAKHNDKISNKIKLNVKWVMDGHVLPPEPNPKINNSTLLGIDVNKNGVRDDVERKIYMTYKRPIERAYMMQYAPRYQKVLTNPRKMAKSKELEQKRWNRATCESYLRNYKNINLGVKTVEFMESEYFNTKDRIKAYLKFNDERSGGIYPIPLLKDANEKNCDFNVTKLLEMEKRKR